MNDREEQLNNDPSFRPKESSLKVKDLVRYLSVLVKLHGNEKTGNLELSEGLRELTKALRPYASRSVFELVDALRPKRQLPDHITSSGRKVALPMNLRSIPSNQVENILADGNYLKIQLVQLGVHRFGIPESKLVRLDRRGVLDSIRAALDHERSLDVISDQARRSGTSRMS